MAVVRKLSNGAFEAADEADELYRAKELVLGTGVRDVVEKEA